MRPTPRSLRRSRLAILAFALLLAFTGAPSLFDLTSPLASAAGAQIQAAPSSCEAVGINWSACDNAFVSDDAYASDARDPPQFARPDADVFAVNWQDFGGNSVHFDELDEAPADDDGTYTQTPVDPGNGDDAEFNLSEIQDPQASDRHVLRYRYRNAVFGGGSAQLDLAVELREGNSLIVRWTHTDVASETYVTRAQALSAAQADLIGNYSDLRVRFDVTFFPGSQTRQLRVTWVEFEAPGVLLPGAPSDTAWTDFGLSLSPTDTVQSVEVGAEWFRISNDTSLNVTVSWNGGLNWAANQTAANLSVDDNLVEWLNFTSATTWDAATLTDANFRVRAGANVSGARLDFLTVRVNFTDAILDITLSANRSSADPGDLLTLNATVRNLGSGTAQNLLVQGWVDTNASYLSSAPAGTYDAASRSVRWPVLSLPAGASASFEWTVRVDVGTPDQATVTSRARVEGEDSGGTPIPPDEASNIVNVRAPIFFPVLRVATGEAESGDEIDAIVYYNNTGTGVARFVWLNWSLGGHYQLVSLNPPLSATPVPDGFRVALGDVNPGSHALTARLRVQSGLQDGFLMGLQVTWAATDGNGHPLPDGNLGGNVRLLAPSMSLGIEAPIQRLGTGSALQINVTIRNTGAGSGTGWLNLSLPSGVRYVGDNGTFLVTAAEEGVSWRLLSIPATSVIQLGIELQANEPGIQSLRLALDYTDGAGTPPVTVFSSTLSIEVVAEPVPAWVLWLAVGLAAGIGLLALFIVRRRLRASSIEEVFVMDASGVLVAHLSRTLTPDKDRDILAAMLKTVQDFVTDAFSIHDDSPMRRIEFGRFSILIERGLHHWIAVVFRGEDHRGIATRLALVSEQIGLDYGEVLATWNGEMSLVRGIQALLKHLWAEERLQLGPLVGLVNRFRGIWPQKQDTAEDPPSEEEGEGEDPLVSQSLRR
ncbi:MAG: hypothetical protein ACE5I4_01815 [Thermoplasmata archaeon]